MGLNETSRVAYNLGETHTCNNFFLFKTYFSVAIKISGEILASVDVVREGKLSSPETLLYPSISN